MCFKVFEALQELTNIVADQHPQTYGQQPFNDPAIMSMRVSEAPNGHYHHGGAHRSGMMPSGQNTIPFGGPPGLTGMPPPGLQRPGDNRTSHAHPIAVQQQQCEFPLSLPSPRYDVRLWLKPNLTVLLTASSRFFAS